jgi:hypothetical protein
MKRIVLLINLVIFTATCNAMWQCPPNRAFSYDNFAAEWALKDAYKSLWLVNYSSRNSQADKDNLSPTADLYVSLYGTNTNGLYYGKCYYTDGDVQIQVTTTGYFNAVPERNPNFHPLNHGGIDYDCRTSAGSGEVCQL